MSSLPAAPEIEMALLACLLDANGCYHEVSDILEARHFGDQRHGEIFRAAASLIEAGKPATPITLKDRFEASGELEEVGGVDYLARLAREVTTPDAARFYAETILDRWQRRELILECQDGIDRATYLDGEESAAEVTAALHRSCEALLGESQSTGKTRREVLADLARDLKTVTPCYRTGFPSLDKAMAGGMYAGKAYGFAARKKSGKTMLAGGISHALNQAGVKHLFVAAEMSGREIEQRITARDLDFNAARWLDGGARQDEHLPTTLEAYAQDAPDNVIYSDEPGIPFDRLRTLVTRAVYRDKIKGFILDYLQLVGGQERNQSRAEHLDQVSQWIANVCRRHGIWALVLAQLNQSENGNIRGGEGMRLAFDQVYAMHRLDDLANADGAVWLEMLETRYTPWQDVGSDGNPGLIMRTNRGPYFEDFGEVGHV